MQRAVHIKNIHELVNSQESLKGFIIDQQIFTNDQSITKYYDQLEMLSTKYIDVNIALNGYNLKQLHLRRCNFNNFKNIISNFANLERLNIFIDNKEGNY